MDSSDAEDIENLFRLYASDVYRFARYLAPTAVDPKDVVQEVFLRALKTRHARRQVSTSKAWLLQITRNYVFDLLRRRKLERHYTAQQKPDIRAVSAPMESLIELEDAVSRLNPNYRQVFVLRCIHDLSVEETSEILRWTKAKVKTTLHRAIRELRETLGAERFDVPNQLGESR